jgi:hypothetical protein
MPTQPDTLSDLLVHPQITLPGFDGPIYNVFTDIISKLYTGIGTGEEGFWFQKSPLEDIGKQIDSNFEIIAHSDFNQIDKTTFGPDEVTKKNNIRITTIDSSSDGDKHAYHAGMFFHIDGGKTVAILLPKANSGKQRSVAVFIQGNIPPEKLLFFLAQLTQTIINKTTTIHDHRVSKMGRSPDQTTLEKLHVFLAQLTQTMTKELLTIYAFSG